MVDVDDLKEGDYVLTIQDGEDFHGWYLFKILGKNNNGKLSINIKVVCSTNEHDCLNDKEIDFPYTFFSNPHLIFRRLTHKPTKPEILAMVL